MCGLWGIVVAANCFITLYAQIEHQEKLEHHENEKEKFSYFSAHVHMIFGCSQSRYFSY